jgi:hypothetical protein
MPTFFVKFTVTPAQGTEQAELVEGAFACCWSVENSAVAAFNKAHFYVTKGGWEITDVTDDPIEVTEEACRHSEVTAENFRKAQQNGIALLYGGWSRDGRTSMEPFPLLETRRFDLNRYVDRQKKLSGKGRCLHFDSNGRCRDIIEAHSIQKSGHLSAIADRGHIYTVTQSIGAIRKNGGGLAFEKRGIGKMSTFAGFCKAHDNAVFAPIDTQVLIPTNEQALLYAYRSLCREFFVKQNAFDLAEAQIADLRSDHPFRFFEDLRTGTASALENLRRHKADFETSLKRKSFGDIEYTLFVSRQKPAVAFSGLIYPHFDFLGRQLQALEDPHTPRDLLTFCSATMGDGWGYLFAWHKTSEHVCREFLRSLATVMHEGSSGADAMFRLVIANCENVAFAPGWWEGLSQDKRAAVCEVINVGASIFAPVESDYLTCGLEGISEWQFESVIASPT